MNLMYQLPKLNVKLLTIVTLFTLLFGGLAMVNTSFAQGTDPVPADGGEVVDPTNPTTGPGSGNFNLGEGVFWNILTRVIYFFFVAIPVSIASYAGQIFNLAIGYLVISMGQLINVSSGIGFAINQLWTVIRDVMNILFIFSLIYLGIKIILYSDDSGTRRALGLLIAAALLVNFSLLITKTIIDFSNIAAYEIFLILGGPAATAAGAGAATYSGISGAFFSATGVQQIVSGATTLSNGGVTNWEMFVNLSLLMFMTAILFIVLTVVFVGGAAMIFVRFIALILYMIFSPVMFLGWVLPAFKKYQDNWWNGFFKKAFFAPAFLFMLYLSLITITQLRAGLDELGLATATANYQAAVNGDAGAIGIFLVYCFAIGMLVASVLVAQQMGATGANATMGTLKALRNGAQSFMWRKTGGKASEMYRKAIDRMDAAARRSDAEGGSRTRRNMARIGRLAATAPLGGTMNARAVAESGEKFGAGGASRQDVSNFRSGQASRAASTNAVANLRQAFGDVNSTDPNRRREARETVRNATSSQLSELAKSSGGRQLILNNAGLITGRNVDSLRNSKDPHITEDFKNDLRGNHETQNRTSAVTDLSGGGFGNELADIRNATKDQLGSLGFNTLNLPQNAARLTKRNLDHLNDLRGEGVLTPDQVRQIRDTRRAAQLAIAAGNGPSVGSTMTPADLIANADATADLHEDVIVTLAPNLTSAHIRKISEKVDTRHHQRIRAAYESNGVTPVQPTTRGRDGQYVANTPEEQKWMFLHRDPIGSTFGTT